MPQLRDRLHAVASRLRRAAWAFGAMVVAAALVVVAATGALTSAGRSLLYATGVYADGGTDTVPPGFFDPPATPTPTITPRGPGTPVLPPLDPTATARGSVIAQRLAALPHQGVGSLSYVVADGRTGATVAHLADDRPVLPASTLKLFTTTAALHLLGPDHTFTTSVVLTPPTSTASPSPAPSSAATIVLVGGGDPYLEQSQPGGAFPHTATLTDLADRTAAALTERGVTAVRLGYDATLFSGPAWNPAWPGEYHDQATPTSALWVGEGRLAGGSPGPRTTDPAGQATNAFAALLRKRHLSVTVTGSTPVTAHGVIPAAADVVAQVDSMPLAQIVEQTLLHSDNDAAEVLFRQVAVAAGRTGTIDHARTALQATLTELGLWTTGMVVHDGSGLSRSDRVVVAETAKLLTMAVSPQHPRLRPLITGLPVAASDGSLRYRFFADGTAQARGDVHAKTGTLNHVSALAGFTVTTDHQLLVFVLVLNKATNDYNARVWLDRASAALSGCGC